MFVLFTLYVSIRLKIGSVKYRNRPFHINFISLFLKNVSIMQFPLDRTNVFQKQMALST